VELFFTPLSASMPESIYIPAQATIESDANRGHVISAYARVDGKHLW